MASAYQADPYSYSSADYSQYSQLAGSTGATYSYDPSQTTQYSSTDQYTPSYSYSTASYTPATYDASTYSTQYQYEQPSYSTSSSGGDQYRTSAASDPQYSTGAQYSSSTATYDTGSAQYTAPYSTSYSTEVGQYTTSTTRQYPASSSTPAYSTEQYQSADSYQSASASVPYAQYSTSTDSYSSQYATFGGYSKDYSQSQGQSSSYPASDYTTGYSKTYVGGSSSTAVGAGSSGGYSKTYVGGSSTTGGGGSTVVGGYSKNYTEGSGNSGGSGGYSKTYGGSSERGGGYSVSRVASGESKSRYSSGHSSPSKSGSYVSPSKPGPTSSFHSRYQDDTRSYPSPSPSSSYTDTKRGAYSRSYGQDSYNSSGRGGRGASSFTSSPRDSGHRYEDHGPRGSSRSDRGGYSSDHNWKRPQDIYTPPRSSSADRSDGGGKGRASSSDRVADSRSGPSGRPFGTVAGKGSGVTQAKTATPTTTKPTSAKAPAAKEAANAQKPNTEAAGGKAGQAAGATKTGAGDAGSKSATKSGGTKPADKSKSEEESFIKPGMTEEEIAKEREIQKKIRESVVTPITSTTPSQQEIRNMLKEAAAPPSVLIPDSLREKLEGLLTENLCKLCSLHLNAPVQAAQHYQGKNHIKRVRLFVASNGCIETGKTAVKKTTTENGAKEVEEDKEKAEEKKEANELEYCTLCDVTFTSLKQAEQHYNGKNHAKKVRLKAATQSLEQAVTQNLVKKGENNTYECIVCKVAVTSEEQLTAHMRGMRHQHNSKLHAAEGGPTRGRGRGRGRIMRGRGRGEPPMFPGPPDQPMDFPPPPPPFPEGEPWRGRGMPFRGRGFRGGRGGRGRGGRGGGPGPEVEGPLVGPDGRMIPDDGFVERFPVSDGPPPPGPPGPPFPPMRGFAGPGFKRRGGMDDFGGRPFYGKRARRGF